MAGPITITDGQLATQDSSAVLVYVFDYDAENLASGVELASVGTFTISPSGLTQDNTALVTGNRKARVRLSGGTVGTVYTIEHVVATNESPAQTKAKHFKLRIT